VLRLADDPPRDALLPPLFEEACPPFLATALFVLALAEAKPRLELPFEAVERPPDELLEAVDAPREDLDAVLREDEPLEADLEDDFDAVFDAAPREPELLLAAPRELDPLPAVLRPPELLLAV
jgi:hypothetical protein